jgi:hypothetical protein
MSVANAAEVHERHFAISLQSPMAAEVACSQLSSSLAYTLRDCRRSRREDCHELMEPRGHGIADAPSRKMVSLNRPDLDCRSVPLRTHGALNHSREATALVCEDGCSLRRSGVLAFRSADQDSSSECERESWLSLAMRSKDSPVDLIRYWNWPSSGGSSRTISYCCPTVGMASRGGAKLTNCPTLNLWLAMSLSAGVACNHLTV